MKNKRIKVILLAAAVFISCVGTIATYALLREYTGSIVNWFSAANIFYLHYHANDGTGAETYFKTDSSIALGSTLSQEFTVTEETPSARDGYKFEGWADDPAAETPDYISNTEGKSTITVTGDDPSTEVHKTVYAVWSRTQFPYYLTYDLGGELGEFIVEAQSGATSHNFPVSGLPADVTNEGYILLGWADAEDAEEPDYQPGDDAFITVNFDETAGEGRKTVYAVWGVDTGWHDYYLNFDINLPDELRSYAGDVTDMSTRIKAASCDFEVPEGPEVSNFDDHGLIFLGWSTTADGSVEFIPGITGKDKVTLQYMEGIDPTELTLYAVWEREFWVSFDGNAQNPAAVKYRRATHTVVADTDPIFVSFSLSLNEAVQEIKVYPYTSYEESEYYYTRGNDYLLMGFGMQADSTVPAESVTLTAGGKNNVLPLYAIWEEGSLALRYDANGGDNAPAAQNITLENKDQTSWLFDIYVKDAGAPALNVSMTPNPGASDAKFLGWAYDADAGTPDFIYDAETDSFNIMQIEVKRDDPVVTLYAVWEYYYVLTFNAGYGGDPSTVPEPIALAPTTSKSVKITVPNDPMPSRGDTYRFQGFYSDTETRRGGENRYFVENFSAGLNFDVTMTFEQTKKTVYARHVPRFTFNLVFDANSNGGTVNNMPAAISLSASDNHEAKFNLAAMNIPTRTGYTFVGWAEKSDATYEWLYDDEAAGTTLYGGTYSTEQVYTVNGDISHTGTLYAIWAQDITLRIRIDYNGGYGTQYTGFRTNNGTNCNPNYSYGWNEKTVNTCSLTPSKTFTFDQYFDPDAQTIHASYTWNSIGEISNDVKGSSSAIYQLRKNNAVFLGFAAKKLELDSSKYYTTAELGSNNRYVDSSGNPDSNNYANAHKSNGSYQIKNITVAVGGENVAKSGNTYTLTLYAVWRSKADGYQIVVKDPDTNAQTYQFYSATGISNDDNFYSAHTTPNRLRVPDSSTADYVKTGMICDFVKTGENGEEKEVYRVFDEWSGKETASSVETSWTQSDSAKVMNFIEPYQKWYLDSGISMSSDDPDMRHEASLDSNGNITYTHTLDLYPKWSQGQLFKLVVNTDGQNGNYLGRWYFERSGTKGEHVRRSYSSDSITATWRADQNTYTWAAGNAGEFYGYIADNRYQFLGYSKDPQGTPTYSVNRRTTTWKHKYASLIDPDSTVTQYWDSIAEAVTIDKNDKAYVTSEPNDDGVLVNTMNLYAQWQVKKHFYLTFNANGGASSWTRSSENHGPNTPEVSFGMPSVTVPTRNGYEFKGYAYTKARADNGIVDIEVIDGKCTTEIVVKDSYAEDKANWTVTANLTTVPRSTTMTVYAVWELKQQYVFKFDYNTGTANSSSSITYRQTEELGVDEVYSTFSPPTPALSGFRFLGYSDQKIAAGSVEDPESYVLYAPNEDGSIGPVHIKKGENGTTSTVTTIPDGAEITTRTLYAVWGENITRFKVLIYPDTDSSNYQAIDKTETGVVASTIYEAGKNITAKKNGFRLSALAYEDGTIATTVTSGKTDSAITVSLKDGATESTDGQNLKTYTLKLYAVWTPLDLYQIKLDPNGGKIWNSSTGQYTYDPILLASTSWTSEVDAALADGGHSISSASFTCSSSQPPLARTTQTFLGFSHSAQSSGSYDYTLSGSSTSRTLYNTDGTSKVIFDRNNTDMGIEAVQDESTGLWTYTLTLYAVWNQNQNFILELDPAGGNFRQNSTDQSVYTFTKSDVDMDRAGTQFSAPQFTDDRTVTQMRPGYTLMGFSYTDWRKEGADPEIDFPITVGSNNRQVTLANVPIVKNDGISITTTAEADGAVIETTKLTLYAVWGTKLQYTSTKSGTDNIPDTEYRYNRDAENRIFKIAEKKPSNQSFSFMGWATSSSGVPTYGAEGFYDAATNMSLLPTFTLDPAKESQTLYAIWGYNYVIAFNPNCDQSVLTFCPDPSIVTSTQSRASISVKSGAVSEDELIPVRSDGVQFLGWADYATDTVPDYSPIDPAYSEFVTIDGKPDGSVASKTLYAVWASNVDSAEVGEDEEVLDKSTPPTTGSGNTTTPTTGSQEPTPTEGSTPPTAQSWQYELRYDANGGNKETLPDNETGSSTEAKVCIAVKFRNEEDDPLPARDGYTFLGWAEKADATKPQYLDGDSVEITAGENGADSVLTLYAVWQENSGAGDTKTPTTGGSDTTTPTTGGSDTTTPTTGSSDTTTPTTGSSDTKTPTTGSSDTKTPTTGGDDTPAPTGGGDDTPPAPTGGGDDTPPAPTGSGDDIGTGGDEA